MMIVMLVAGIGLALAGLLAIGFGIPIKEFSTGNTLIIAGVMGVCTGAIMLALSMVVRELKNIVRRLGAGVSEGRGEAMVRPVLPTATRDSGAASGFPDAEQPGGSGPFSSAPPPPFPSAVPPPWQNEAVLRDHPIPEPLHPEPPPSAPKPKRNLLFSSISRRERERAEGRGNEPLSLDLLSSDIRPRPPNVPPVETAKPPPVAIEDSWPKAGRATPGEGSLLRRGRMPPTLPESNDGPARTEDKSEVTVLKSGVVDGMAYSLYSDGSIEAQMPEGMMRFATIDELRAHLDQRS
jgi:hypothetical protein